MKKILVLVIISSLVTYTLVSKKINKLPKEASHTMESSKKTLPSGLEYTILAEGTGADSPNAGRKVTVHYTGWLNNDGQPGKKFDSSVDRNAPFSFTIGVGQVIKGWDEGVMSMKKGEKRRLFIPATLGYGSRGAGAIIPPNADLIFDVELISFS